jgi:hypothetical protein
MVVVLNRTVVMAEVMRWAQLQLSGALQCPLKDVTVKAERGPEGVNILFDGPGIEEEGEGPVVTLIFQQMMAMADERLKGLNTRRAR